MAEKSNIDFFASTHQPINPSTLSPSPPLPSTLYSPKKQGRPMRSFSNPFIIDLRALALMRMGIGLLILVDLCIRWPDIDAFMSNIGAYDIATSLGYAGWMRWSLYWLLGDVWVVKGLFVIESLIALLFMLGIRTRLMTVLSFIFLVSLHNRNPLLLQGGDNLLLLLSFWGMFLPLGARWSFDAAMTKQSLKTNHLLTIGTVGLMLQIVSVYFFSAFLKNSDEWMVNGQAIYFALSNNQFAVYLADYWHDQHWLTVPLTHYVWWLELLGPLLAISPFFNQWTRSIAAFCFITLEIGFLLNINVGLFPFISITSLLILIPPAAFDWLRNVYLSKVNTPSMTMYFDKDCGFCEKTCYLIRGAFGLRNTQIKPAQDDPEIGPILEKEYSWVLVDQYGKKHLRWEALVYVISQGERFRFKAKILALFNPVGDRVYTWIGNNRGVFGKITSTLMPWREPNIELSKNQHALALFFVIIVAWWNFYTIPSWHNVHGFETGIKKDARLTMPVELKNIFWFLRLDQKWNMFAPYPTKRDGWHMMPGLTVAGNLVDPMRGSINPPPTGWYDTYIPEQWPNYRWRKYTSRLQSDRYEKYLPNYLDWLCRDWDSQHEDKLLGFDWYYITQLTPPPGGDTSQELRLVARHSCNADQPLPAKAVEQAVQSYYTQ
jgi:predicted DCC family thiol-disulfide oxidoreductase YuxK